MFYTDEDSQEKFHASDPIMQMVCQFFENLCFTYGETPEFIDLIDEHNAILGVPGISPEQLPDLCDQLNVQFPRKDDQKTCTVYDGDVCIVRIYTTVSSDFKHLH